MFEFVRCSKNDVRVRSMFDKMVFDTSLKRIHLRLLQLVPTLKKAAVLLLQGELKKVGRGLPTFLLQWYYSWRHHSSFLVDSMRKYLLHIRLLFCIFILCLYHYYLGYNKSYLGLDTFCWLALVWSLVTLSIHICLLLLLLEYWLDVFFLPHYALFFFPSKEDTSNTQSNLKQKG